MYSAMHCRLLGWESVRRLTIRGQFTILFSNSSSTSIRLVLEHVAHACNLGDVRIFSVRDFHILVGSASTYTNADHLLTG